MLDKIITPVRVIFVLTLLLVATVVGMGFLLDRAESRALQNAFMADSIRAALDTTRIVNEKALKVLGDSLTAYERLAVQTKIEQDKLDKALKRTTAVNIKLTAQLDSVRSTGTAVVTETPTPIVDSTAPTPTIRSAAFQLDTFPIHITAKVKLPTPPGVGSVDWLVRFDPIRQEIRVQCGKAVGKVRPVSIVAIGHKGITFDFGQPVADTDVCNAERPSRWKLPWWSAPLLVLSTWAVVK